MKQNCKINDNGLFTCDNRIDGPSYVLSNGDESYFIEQSFDIDICKDGTIFRANWSKDKKCWRWTDISTEDRIDLDLTRIP